MSSQSEMLAARKSLLVARSSLDRLTMVREVDALREGLQWRRVGAAMATSAPVRPVILGALVLLAGRKRIAKAIGLATQAIMLVKLVGAVRKLATHQKTPCPEDARE